MCEHECVNTVGSFLCRCHSGYILAPDRHSCIPVNNCEPIVLLEPFKCNERITTAELLSVPVRSTEKSDTLMSAGTCSFTCQDFLNMKSNLLQLKLKLGNTPLPNQVTHPHLRKHCGLDTCSLVFFCFSL